MLTPVTGFVPLAYLHSACDKISVKKDIIIFILFVISKRMPLLETCPHGHMKSRNTSCARRTAKTGRDKTNDRERDQQFKLHYSIHQGHRFISVFNNCRSNYNKGYTSLNMPD